MNKMKPAHPPRAAALRAVPADAHSRKAADAIADLLEVDFVREGIIVRTATEIAAAELSVEVMRGGGAGALCRHVATRRTARRLHHAFACSELSSDAGTPPTVRIGIRGLGHTTHTGPDRFSGRFLFVRDYAVCGWVSSLTAASIPPGQLFVDGEPAMQVTLSAPPSQLSFFASPDHTASFTVPLPAAAVSGRRTRIEVRFGNQVFAPERPWRSELRVEDAEWTKERLRLTWRDLGLGPGAATVHVLADGKRHHVLRTGDTSDEADPTEPYSVQVKLPKFAREVEVRAGVDAQASLCRLHRDDIAGRIAALRAESRALLGGGALPETLDQRRAVVRRLKNVRRNAAAHWEAASDGGPPAAAARPAIHKRRPAETLPGISIVIPVYGDVEATRNCLDSVFRSASCVDERISEVVLVDDASPHPEMSDLLADAARRHPALVKVITNRVNAGFVQSVNRGLKAVAGGDDVVLLNADTVVPGRFAARLQAVAYARTHIASVTPLSNNATIASFPDPDRSNDLWTDLDDLDAIAEQRYGRKSVEAPTGVGFCLYLKRAALREIGGFSAFWGRGYCEEVDWCLRARDLGWSHAIAPGIFVHHAESRSFGTKERAKLLQDNHRRLEKRYPEYLAEVQEFVRSDELSRFRGGLAVASWRPAHARTTVLISHNLGGGTDRHLSELTARLRRRGMEAIEIRLFRDKAGVLRALVGRGEGEGRQVQVAAADVEAMIAELQRTRRHVGLHYHSLLYAPQALRHLPEELGLPYNVTVHDYQWFCPRITLVNPAGHYCGQPDAAVCRRCISTSRFYDFGEENLAIQTDVGDWVRRNRAFLSGAERVICPSSDTADRMRAKFGLGNISVEPHAAALVTTPGRSVPAAPVMRVAVVGAISISKGAGLVLDLCRYIERERLPMHVTIIGEGDLPADLDECACVSVTGRYERDALAARLAEANPHAIFLPSVWPETYSYVLSEVTDFGRPVLCFDIGAQAERSRSEGLGIVMPVTNDPAEIYRRLREAGSRAGALDEHSPPIAREEIFNGGGKEGSVSV